MPLIGIVAKKKDIQMIKKGIQGKSIDIIEINKQSIKNLKNIKFNEVVFLQDIELEEQEYKYMNEIISKSKYLILTGDIELGVLKKLDIQKTIKLITFGFNSKATITISSVNEEKVIVCLQRNIEKENGEILENQEKQIMIGFNKKIYNNLAVFIIKELHNL